MQLILVQSCDIGRRQRSSQFVSRESSQDMSRSCFKVLSCFAIHENKSREMEWKSSTTKQPLSISNWSITLGSSSYYDIPSESLAMIIHTINLIPYEQNHATSSDVTTPQTTSLWKHNILPPLHDLPHISQRLRLSITLIPSTAISFSLSQYSFSLPAFRP